jgi:hypothetical protein
VPLLLELVPMELLVPLVLVLVPPLLLVLMVPPMELLVLFHLDSFFHSLLLLQ